MQDDFWIRADSMFVPSRSTFAVTPHDGNALPKLPKALYVGTAGNIALRAADDAVDTVFRNVPAGAILPVRAAYVRATGTTAADITAFACCSRSVSGTPTARPSAWRRYAR